MFVKYDKTNDMRFLYLNNAIVIEKGKECIAVGKENKMYTTEKAIAFDIATLTDDKTFIDRVKRFVKKAMQNENEKRRLNYFFDTFTNPIKATIQFN